MESFSHGMKQRLVMCAAFLHRPRAVLVDEPMVGLDPRGAHLIKDVFREMSRKGVAILMSTHTLEVAQEMCDRISIILGGKIIARGTVDELRALAGSEDERAHARVPEAHRGQRAAARSTSRDDRSPSPICCCPPSGPRETARAGARRGMPRAAVFSARSRLGVAVALFAVFFWLAWQLLDYEELGDYLIRLGLSLALPHLPRPSWRSAPS